jgi:hypothetical protein
MRVSVKRLGHGGVTLPLVMVLLIAIVVLILVHMEDNLDP